jgi:hypothetical protein
VRFLLDEDVFPCLKFILEEWGHEADSVTLRPGLLSQPDPVLLSRASQENRVFVTFNIKHFEELHQEYQDTGQEHAGIIVCRKLDGYENFHRLLRWMRNILKTVLLAQFPNSIYYLHIYV